MQLAGVGAGAASAIASGIEPEPAHAAAPTPSGKPSAGYRETEHVKAYYALARI